LFYRHDEIEFGVPFERYRDVLDRVLRLLAEEDYFSVVEVRFTPDASQALLGPGVGRRTAYIELATPMSRPTAGMYARVEQIFLEHGGRPHLGKYCGMSADGMLQAFGDRYVRFQQLRRAEDPEGKFLSGFTEQIF
jgi:FAD/FMN-containing dehydrogenase